MSWRSVPARWFAPIARLVDHACARNAREGAAGPHVKVSARPPSARRAHRGCSPSYAPVPLGRRRRGGACAVIRLHMTCAVAGSAAIDAAALFARRCPSRRAMACGKSSGRTDASLSHLPTGRPPRCALLPIGDSTALVPHPVSPLPPQPSLYCRLAGGWPARRLRSAIAWMRRRACRSRGRSLTVCAMAVVCLPPGAPSGRRAAVGLLLAGVSRLVRPSFWNDAYVDLLWKWP